MAKLHVMETPKIFQEYKFSWRINNFSVTPMNFDGPLFSPIPDRKGTFCFQVAFSEKNPTDEQSRFRVYLKTLDNYEESICMGSDLSLLDKDGYTKKRESTEVKAIDTITLLMDQVFDTNNKSDALHYYLKIHHDKLIIAGTLSFYAYDMPSKACKIETLPEVRSELEKDFKNMFLESNSCDVTFSFGDSSFPAHKAILGSRSTVFAKMFDHDMLEQNSNKVIIEDVGACVFHCFLIFLYTGVLEDKTWDTVFTLYSLADKYQVKSLQKTCSEILGKNLTVDSVCSALLLSDLHGDDGLKKKVNYFIAENLEVLGTKEWAQVVVTKPQLVENVMQFVKWYCSLRFVTL